MGLRPATQFVFVQRAMEEAKIQSLSLLSDIFSGYESQDRETRMGGGRTTTRADGGERRGTGYINKILGHRDDEGRRTGDRDGIEIDGLEIGTPIRISQASRQMVVERTLE